MVESAAGPWRTSGEWWRVPDARVQVAPGVDGSDLARLRAKEESPALRRGHADPPADRRWIGVGWNRDEWDVALSDGGVYRIYRDRSNDRWLVDGIVD